MIPEGILIWLCGSVFGFVLALFLVYRHVIKVISDDVKDAKKIATTEAQTAAELHALLMRRMLRVEALVQEHLPKY